MKEEQKQKGTQLKKTTKGQTNARTKRSLVWRTNKAGDNRPRVEYNEHAGLDT